MTASERQDAMALAAAATYLASRAADAGSEDVGNMLRRMALSLRAGALQLDPARVTRRLLA
jgi:hypothetical protein